MNRTSFRLFLPILCALSALSVLLFCIHISVRANPILQVVTQALPPPNSHTAQPGTNITATFSGMIDTSSVVSDSFWVHGNFQGHLNGLFDFSTSSIRFDPELYLHPNELVATSVTTDVLVDGSHLLDPYVWQFRTGVITGTGALADSGQRLGDQLSQDLALGDLDGDGDLDAVLANAGYSSYWFNQNGVFMQVPSPWFQFVNTMEIALGDLDGDGDLDAYLATHETSANGTQDYVYFYDDTIDRFVLHQDLLIQTKSFGVELGDLDGDGDLDAFVACADNQPHRIWFNDGTGTLGDMVSYGSYYAKDVDLGDLDDDGDLDAVVANVGTNNIWLNDGAGAFTLSGTLGGSENSADIELGDLDNDGDLDVFVVNYDLNHVVCFNNGSASFSGCTQFGDTYDSRGLDLGDLDADGDLDAVVANANAPDEIWHNNGSGVFTLYQYLGDSASRGIALADITGNGALDAFFAVYSMADPTNRVYYSRVPHDLVIQKLASSELIKPGEKITYTLEYRNNGAFVASSVIITDTIPAGLQAISYSSVGATVTPTGEISYTWQVASLATNEGGVITITATVNPQASGEFILPNQATITDAISVDDYPQDNLSSVETLVDGQSPSVISVLPASASIGVDLSAPVVITFSEGLAIDSFEFSVDPDPGDLVANWDMVTKERVSLTHSPFLYETSYTVTLSAGLDLAGNPLDNAPYSWQFRTEDWPFKLYLPTINVNLQSVQYASPP